MLGMQLQLIMFVVLLAIRMHYVKLSLIHVSLRDQLGEMNESLPQCGMQSIPGPLIQHMVHVRVAPIPIVAQVLSQMQEIKVMTIGFSFFSLFFFSFFLITPHTPAPYLPAGHATCGTPGGSEGVFSGPKSNIPWSIKWSRALCNTLISEGFFGGHVGPFFHREKFGVSFWDSNPTNIDSSTPTRFKWSGALRPSMYCDPAKSDCDPNKTGPGSVLDTCNATACPSSSSASSLIPGVLALIVAMVFVL